MWHSLFSFAKSWTKSPEDVVEDASKPVVVVTAAPPPSFRIDPLKHVHNVERIQRRKSHACSPVRVSPHTRSCTPSPVAHPYASASPAVPSSHPVDTINALMGELLDDAHEFNRRPSVRTRAAAVPPPLAPAPDVRASSYDGWRDPLLERGGESPIADECGSWEYQHACADASSSLARQDHTRPFTNGFESVSATPTTMTSTLSRDLFMDLLDAEETQRNAIERAEAHCWCSLGGTLSYVCSVLTQEAHRSKLNPSRPQDATSPQPPLSSWLRSASDADGLTDTSTSAGFTGARRDFSLRERSASPFSVGSPRPSQPSLCGDARHPYAVPEPCPARSSAHRAPRSSPPTSRPFLRSLALNVPAPAKPQPCTPSRSPLPQSPRGTRGRRSPLVSPPRHTAARESLLLSPPAPPLVPSSPCASPSSASAVQLCGQAEAAAVTWVPVTRNARGQLQVAWQAWNTATSAAVTAQTTTHCAWPHPPSPASSSQLYRALDGDEMEPTVEVSALSAPTDGYPPEPLQHGAVGRRLYAQEALAARRPRISVIGHHRDVSSFSTPAFEAARLDEVSVVEAESEEHLHSTVLRIDASEISALDLSGAEPPACHDGDDRDTQLPLAHVYGRQERGASPPPPRRYFQGYTIHSL